MQLLLGTPRPTVVSEIFLGLFHPGSYTGQAVQNIDLSCGSYRTEWHPIETTHSERSLSGG